PAVPLEDERAPFRRGDELGEVRERAASRELHERGAGGLVVEVAGDHDARGFVCGEMLVDEEAGRARLSHSSLDARDLGRLARAEERIAPASRGEVEDDDRDLDAEDL